MKNLIQRITCFLVLTFMIFQLLPMSKAGANTLTGSGTASDPFIVTTAEQLDAVRQNISAHYKLGADIDLAGYTNWVPIGNYLTQTDFAGVFDGNGHTIKNLTVNNPGYDGGLFGDIAVEGVIKNLNLENVSISGDNSFQNSFGALVGWNSGTVDHVNVKVKKIESATYVGGIAGGNDGMISYCTVRPFDDSSLLKTTAGSSSIGEVGGIVGYNMGIIEYAMSAVNVTTSSQAAGGIAGRNQFGNQDQIIRYSYNTGNVQGYDWVGGLVGIGGKVENSYSTGNVSGTTSYRTDNAIGGIFGYYDGSNSHHIYSIGKVTGTFGAKAGGFLGISNPGAGKTAFLSNAFWDTQSSGNSSFGTNYSGTLSSLPNGMTTALMKDPTTFAGWDSTIWNLNSGEYPTLKAFVSAPATYTIYYNGNGSTSGTVPTDSNKYENGASVTIASNNGNLVKTGFAFVGWNTQPDGNGINYSPGQTFVMGSSNVTLYGKWLSTNADLSNLTLSQGTLTPAFDAGTLNYTASVANAVTSVDITATLADATATLKVNGSPATSGNAEHVPLLVGSNTITIEVTAQDGTTTKTYTVAVDRADIAPTGTTVSSSANPSPFGETVTLTANVTAATGTPTGTVTFYHGSDEIGNVPVSDGQAELTLSSLEGGTYSIHAVYSGDADFAGSQSGIMTQEITPAFTTVGLTASSTKIKPGQSVTLTVGVDSPAGTPSGTVKFMEGSNELGEVDIDSSGEGSITLSSLSHGEHTIHAVYSGNANFSSNHSDDLKVIVNTAPDAQEEEYSLITGSTLDIAGPGLLEEATDSEDDWLTAKVDQEPDHGTVSILENGGFTYTPDMDFRGEDSFTYVAYDGWHESSPATVTLYVYDGLQIGKGTANPGERVSIPVSMTSQGHVAGLQFDISYDHDLLNLEELTAGTLLEDSSLEFSSNELSNGNTRVIVANIDNVNIPEGIGGLLDLTFLVDSEAYSGQQSILKILNPKIVDASVTHATYDEPSVTDLTYNYLYVDGLFTVVDTMDPTLTLTPTPTGWTNQCVVIQVDANGTGSAIKVKKWAVGEKDAAYFAEEGTEFSTGSISVCENGTYTIFVEDDAGNTTVITIEISNIDKESPILSFTKLLDATEKAVHIQVTGNGTGSQIIEWKYAQGIQTVDSFAGNGTDFTDTFDITENVPYTVYAKDEAGNTVVKIIYVMGDNSGDYIVDVTDWVATINYVLERTIPTEAQKLVTDMNRDGDINIMDPVMIANVIMSGGYPE